MLRGWDRVEDVRRHSLQVRSFRERDRQTEIEKQTQQHIDVCGVPKVDLGKAESAAFVVIEC